MYCPKVDSECIGTECYAYKPSIGIYKCSVCGEKYQLGGTCSEKGHLRNSVLIQEPDSYCIVYDVKIKIGKEVI